MQDRYIDWKWSVFSFVCITLFFFSTWLNHKLFNPDSILSWDYWLSPAKEIKFTQHKPMNMNTEEVVKLFVADTFIVSCNKSGGLKEYMMKKHSWDENQYREYLSIYMNHIYKLTLTDGSR